jgi:pSer/pThr/pTyr-binding forkhead associated (FHA) protein
MADITLRVIDGADRGRVFADMPTPLTIGREEGNTIQLNDERISRFHIKIQEDQAKLILTDLDSTNGTKVNGEDVQLRVLRFGDVIALGRSVLLVGSRRQIAGRLRELRGAGIEAPTELARVLDGDSSDDDAAWDLEVNWMEDPDVQRTLHAVLPPELPVGLSPGQAAQVSELIDYVHLALRELIRTVKIKGQPERVTVDAREWQILLDLQDRLAGYLRKIGEPDAEDR